MTPCKCGQGVAKGANGYCGRGCSLRAMSREERSARAKAWARTHPGHYRRIGAIGNKRTRPNRWDDLLDRWLGDDGLKDPRGALREAYRRGYGAGFQRGKVASGVRYGRRRAA